MLSRLKITLQEEENGKGKGKQGRAGRCFYGPTDVLHGGGREPRFKHALKEREGASGTKRLMVQMSVVNMYIGRRMYAAEQ